MKKITVYLQSHAAILGWDSLTSIEVHTSAYEVLISSGRYSLKVINFVGRSIFFISSSLRCGVSFSVRRCSKWRVRLWSFAFVCVCVCVGRGGICVWEGAVECDACGL